MLTILKPLNPKKPFNVKTVYLCLRMYGFEPLVPVGKYNSGAYYAIRGKVKYSITITPQEVTIGYTPIEEDVLSAIAGLCNATIEIEVEGE